MSEPIVGILLAAGQGRRFGTNKLLHPLPEGDPIGVCAAQNLSTALPQCIAVIDGKSDEFAARLEALGMHVVINENAAAGMGSSIACGIRASSSAAGWVLALGDMPYIQPATIARVAEGLRAGGQIIAPVYRQQRGHPVGFARRYREELLALHGDHGARGIIETHRARLASLATDDAGVVRDIDRRADIAAAADYAS